MKEKAFQKATKAQFKQLDAMQKKHKKERETMQKNQCTAIEKLAAKKSWVCNIKHLLVPTF